MTVPVRLEDGSGGTNRQARISEHGELLTRPFDYSSSVSQTLDAGNTAFNFYLPKSNTFFIITGIVTSANSKVDNIDGTIVTIYQSDSVDSLTEIANPININLGRTANATIIPINIKTIEGAYINMKHDDTTMNAKVFGTIFGYYIPTDGFEFSIVP